MHVHSTGQIGDTSSDRVDTDFEEDYPRGYMPQARMREQPRIKLVTQPPIALTPTSKRITPGVACLGRECANSPESNW